MKHPWLICALNLLLVMAIYTLSRVFFYWINIDLYPNVDNAHLIEMVMGGWRFDLTALLYLNSLYILLVLLPLPIKIRNHKHYIRVANYSYFIPNIQSPLLSASSTMQLRYGS